ncbi:TfoX/Sxy family protein [Rudaea sp.]|uniref:TfoX/Sxy family protein n=1 Tax=Rudaea sp. TaxID=2136325 RepID=UPI0039E21667
MAARDTAGKIRNVGPKSAAWLRQVGVRTQDDLVRLGAVEAFMKVKRAGFRPSLNLLYALEGALADCHWADLPEERKAALLTGAEAAEAANPIKTRWQKQADRSAAVAQASGNSSDEGNGSPHGFPDDADGAAAHADKDSAANRFE